MKQSSIFLRSLLIAVIVGVGAHTALISQQPNRPAPPAQIDPAVVQSIQALKEANTKLLERQAAMLEQLKVIEEEARQARIFAKRT